MKFLMKYILKKKIKILFKLKKQRKSNKIVAFHNKNKLLMMTVKNC